MTVNLHDALAAINDRWSPRLIASLNGQEVKLAKLGGEFVWHAHADADELFLVIEGSFEMHYRDRVDVLNEGDLTVVPRGVEHKPVAPGPCSVLLFEPAGVVNTGDAPPSDLTNPSRPFER
jgi:mannose-6-phosphate isomerase-like protein (cupin superfamily)